MSKETILILDSERYVRMTLRTLLESEGYLTITADTIKMALDHFSKDGISGLITEYYIDQFCTLEVVRDFKRRFPEVYVMMLTNNDANEREYEEIINAGVDDLFKKPFSGKKILIHLKKGLKQREIFLQKNRLEQELSRIGYTRKTEEGTLVEKSPPPITNWFNNLTKSR